MLRVVLLSGALSAVLVAGLFSILHSRAQGIIDYHYRTNTPAALRAAHPYDWGDDLADGNIFPAQAQEIIEGLYLGSYKAALDLQVLVFHHPVAYSYEL